MKSRFKSTSNNGSEAESAGVSKSRSGPTLALAFFIVSIPWMFGLGLKLPVGSPELASLGDGPVWIEPTAEDQDGDGLDDALEDTLLARYAPTLIMAEDEPSLPVSTSWIRKRVQMGAPGPTMLGVALPPRRFDAETRRGSTDRRDWAVYGHAYPSSSGGVYLQYWYYFPYNDGPLFFDHESDWEHVTVELDANHEPVGAAYARHEHNAPGARYAWSEIGREGNHPIVLIARGTHASYARADEAPFWEKLPSVDSDERGLPIVESEGVLVWRPGRDPEVPPVVNVGERGAPRDGAELFMGYQGLWGAALLIGTGPPPGPPWQRGFCVDAALGGCP